jgi:hypothetical protein
MLWGARASGVLASASRRNELFSILAPNRRRKAPKWEYAFARTRSPVGERRARPE